MYKSCLPYVLWTLIFISSCNNSGKKNTAGAAFENDTSLFISFADSKEFSNGWSKENILVYHVIALPDILHPSTGKTAMGDEIMQYTQMYLINTNMFEQGLRPQLVKALPEVSEDGLKFTYELRDEPLWDNGEPLTSADVVFTIKANKCPLTDNPSLKPYLDRVKNIIPDVSDPKKFTIEMTSPYLQNIAIWSDIPVMQKSFYDKKNILDKFSLMQFNDTAFNPDSYPDLKKWSEDFNSPELGAEINLLNGIGMYRVSAWEAGQQIILQRKENHWSKASTSPYELSYPDKIIFRLNTDAVSQMLEFRKQNYDASATLSLKTLAALQQDSVFNDNYNSRFTNSFNYIYIALNTRPDGSYRKKLFDNINVRRAMAMLIPYEQINQTICSGKYKRQSGPVAQYKKDHNPEIKPVEYNPDEAKKILAAEGWSDTDNNNILDKTIDGKKTEFEFSFNYYSVVPDWKDYVQLISESMMKAGIKVIPNPVEPAVMKQNATAHDFDAMLGVWNQTSAPEDPTQLWHTTSWKNHGDNYSGFGNETTDALIDSIAITIDDVKRRELSARFQKIVADEHPYIFLFASQRRIAVHKRFGNCKFFFDKPGLMLNTLQLLKSGSLNIQSL